MTEQPTLASRAQRPAARHLVGNRGEETQQRKGSWGKREWGSLPLGRKLWATDFALSHLPDPVWVIYFQAMSVRVLGKETHWYLCRLHAKISGGCEADSFRVIAGLWRCWLLLISHDAGLQGNSVRCWKCLVTLKGQNFVAKPK